MSTFPENWREVLDKVNADLNLFPWVSDQEQYNVDDYWEDIRKSRKGDCDDYVNGKDNVLADQYDFPRENLRLASCEAPYFMNVNNPGGGHLVLDVEGPDGKHYILSNGLRVMTRGAFLGMGFKPLLIQETGGQAKWVEWVA